MALSPGILPITIKHCQGCGIEFTCGEGGQNGGCWCMDQPIGLPVPSSDSNSDCYCPNCLEKIRQQYLNKGI
ncbi:cysteine-rich CWC family protein [Deefgea rivuli]|uniref:cysteine-rich CWC family protein n=1 Tax=Deefgea rivuli TaxID=400948 RepID=UPI000687D46E|nr:cysteine-rich CWC family protein [Deefgea rivuli]